MIAKRLFRQPASANECPACRDNREKHQSFGVLLLLITAVGCGIPALVTIPLMVYAAVRGGQPCPDCRS